MIVDFHYKVAKEFIDLNHHLTETGYYHYAIQGIWDLNKEHKLIDLYEKYKIGPIIFDTQIFFQKEVFENEMITVSPRLKFISNDGRKWQRTIKIFRENGGQSAHLLSNGAYLSHPTRKVVTPPKEIVDAISNLNALMENHNLD